MILSRVKRYGTTHIQGDRMGDMGTQGFGETADGEYVSYSDYEALREERDELNIAAKALVDKLILTESYSRPIYESALIHGVKYNGPTYEQERDELLKLLNEKAE